MCPHPNGDTLQMTELTEQKEGLGLLSFKEKVGVPVAREQGVGQEWARETFSFLCFCSCWVLPRDCGPSGIRGECEEPSSGDGGRGASPSWGAHPLASDLPTPQFGCAGRRGQVKTAHRDWSILGDVLEVACIRGVHVSGL